MVGPYCLVFGFRCLVVGPSEFVVRPRGLVVN